jgi:hypothetical protein
VLELPSIRAKILAVSHDDPFARHFGFAHTLELVRRRYFWYSIRTDVKAYVKTCRVCQRTKVKRHRPYGELVLFTPLT